MTAPELLDVPVAGGTLRVGRWPGDGPVVVAAHGITANHVSFSALARHLDGRVTLVAPDLRGRGGSGNLPGPYSMAAHADDLVAVLDHLGAESAVILGHSMGGFVAVVAAHRHPERVSALLLVDGGLPLPVPEGVAVDDLLQAVIGPAMSRLSMEFADAEAHRDFWRAHPALAEWTPDIEAYVDYDVTGSPLRSKVSIDAVRGDATDTMVTSTVADAVAGLSVPAGFVRAEGGMFGAPPPLFPAELVRAHPQVVDLGEVPGTNHYTLVISDKGAAALAAHVLAAVSSPAWPEG